MTKLIEDETVQNIIKYLQKHPYEQVYQGIAVLMQLPDAPKSKEIKKPDLPQNQ